MDKDDLTIADLPMEVSGRVEAMPNGCWEWQNYRNPAGYGQIRVNWKGWLVHRFVYHHCVAEIPEGLVVMHTCDNPACCRPKHLELGTHNDNQQDKIQKGRGNEGERNGHAKFTKEQIQSIRERVANGEKQLHIANEFGVNRSCICKIVKRYSWKD